jgi:GT2 family glycosyltransferase
MQLVSECVESINKFLAQTDYECLVISNSQYLQRELDSHQSKLVGAKIIDSKNNLGYASGVNIGISHASGEYIYVLNPDCLLTDHNILQIMNEMDKDDKWAITGPMVIDQSGIIQASCRRFPKPWTFLLVRSFLSVLPGADRERKRYLMEDFDRQSRKEVDWVSGGAIVAKSSAIKQFGGMDERYFLYMEDVDWCRSCWNYGFRVVYDPQSVVIHAGQHQSVNFTARAIFNKHHYYHLNSLLKYILKPLIHKNTL